MPKNRPELFKRIVDTFYKAVIVYDRDNSIIYWNPAAEKITGYKASDTLGKKCHEIDLNGRGMCRTEKCPIERLKNGGAIEQYKKIMHAEGYRVPVLSRLWALQAGRRTVYVNTLTSLSAPVSAYEKIEQLEELVFTDGLTGVMNRRYAEGRIASKIEGYRLKSGPKFGLIFMDIDNFKSINDSCNHEVGDRVIQFIAMTITENMKGIDFAARWGGEEFIVVVDSESRDYAARVAENFRAALDRLRVESGGKGMKITASFGVTTVNNDDDVSRLVARADRLMYLSKKSGKNTVTAG